MCTLPLFIMSAGMYMQYKSANMSAQAYKAQAEEAKKTAEFNAGQALIEKKQSDLQALSFQNSRLEQLDEEMQSNDAWFAFLGRDAPSELLEYQKTKAYSEIGRGDLMAFLQGSNSIMEANQEIRRGNNAVIQGGYAASAARLKGYSNMFSMAYGGYQTGMFALTA